MTKAGELQDRQFRMLQDIQFQLMELGSFNKFDGEKVSWSLKENYGLWKRFIFVDCYNSHIALRDMEKGKWNADTLLIIVKEKFAENMIAVAKSWKANSVDCLKHGLALRKGEWMIKVWWD